MIDQPTALYFNVSKLIKNVLAPGESITIDIQPKEGLPAGNYDEVIMITGSNVNAEVSASFTVAPADYILSVSSLDVAFSSVYAPSYTQPAAQTVTVTNSGTGAITLDQPTATSFDIGTLSTMNLPIGGTASFSIRPKADLTAGTHVERVNITGSNGASSTIVASFTVLAASYLITATPVDLTFPVAQAPSYTPPAAQTVTVRNNGTGSVTLYQPISANFEIGALSSITVLAGGSATFTVSPKTSLRPGNYIERINIAGSNSASSSIVATFTVAPVPDDIIAISVSEASFEFDSAAEGYESPAEQIVTINNDGTGAVTLNQPSSNNFNIGALSTTDLTAANNVATFTITPKAGLAIGSYAETIVITGSGTTGAIVNALVEVTFTVTEGVKTGGSGGGCNAGFAILAALAIAGLVIRKRL
jgi:Synergist-CTERM protein sorting domain-containing protein